MLERLNKNNKDGREEVQYVAVYKTDGNLLKCYFGVNDSHGQVQTELQDMVSAENALLKKHGAKYGWSERNLPVRFVQKPAGLKMHAEQAALQEFMNDLSTAALDPGQISRIVVRGKKVPCNSCAPVLQRFQQAIAKSNGAIQVVIATPIDTETPQKHVDHSKVQIASPSQSFNPSTFYSDFQQGWNQ